MQRLGTPGHARQARPDQARPDQTRPGQASHQWRGRDRDTSGEAETETETETETGAETETGPTRRISSTRPHPTNKDKKRHQGTGVGEIKDVEQNFTGTFPPPPPDFNVGVSVCLEWCRPGETKDVFRFSA